VALSQSGRGEKKVRRLEFSSSLATNESSQTIIVTGIARCFGALNSKHPLYLLAV
jgi:hypothetical protein